MNRRNLLCLYPSASAIFLKNDGFASSTPDDSKWNKILQLWNHVKLYREHGDIKSLGLNPDERIIGKYMREIKPRESYALDYAGAILGSVDRWRVERNGDKFIRHRLTTGEESSPMTLEELQSSEIAGGRLINWLLVPQLCFQDKHRLGNQVLVDRNQRGLDDGQIRLIIGLWEVVVSENRPIIFFGHTSNYINKRRLSFRNHSAEWLFDDGTKGDWNSSNP